MYIMKLSPSFKDYIWGGQRLNKEFNLSSGLDITAEAWVLSCHKDGECVVQNGKYKGKFLSEVIKDHKDYVGFLGKKWEDFPILIKFIDAKDNLSLQVHPDENYANKYENGHGKTECWYIIDCDEDAELILGFNKNITKSEIELSIQNGTVLDCVNHIKVKKGEVYYIPAGTIHAIGKGLLILEVQQNSNSTYRVFDYNRLKDGKPRELHIEKALEVLNGRKIEPEPIVPIIYKEGNTLIDCDIFKFEEYSIKNRLNLTCSVESFISLICIEGFCSVSSENELLELKKGESIFIPAGMGKIEIIGECKLLKTTIN